MALAKLPIDEVLPQILDALRHEPNLVLRAPPGAGKTTRVGPAILDAKLVSKHEQILMLEPRRVAARASARRIAQERGSALGEDIGYQVRFEKKAGPKTRFLILTEGLLTRKLQADPTLDGIGCVILDEFHERSIQADLALAFLREIQQTLRPELKIVVMSATLLANPISAFLGHCKIVDAPGRSFPVEKHYLDRPDERWLEEVVASGVRRAIDEANDDKDLLVFLPGAGEIRKTQSLLADRLGDRFELCPLYGDLSSDEQDRALSRRGRRKIVLATNIAETSLTIEGVTTVVDSGWVKLLHHDPGRGIDRLDMKRISRASAEQRAGRAGRTEPGRVFRLWTQSEEQRFVEHERPEVERIDLAPVLLEVLGWAPRDPRAFGWYEAPPPAHVDRALELLREIGAVERDGFRLTPLGEKLRAFPVHPRIAACMVAAHRLDVVSEGALICALIAERDIVRRSRDPSRASIEAEGPSDLLHRRDLIYEIDAARDRRGLAQRLSVDLGAIRSVELAATQLAKTARRVLEGQKVAPGKDDQETRLRRMLLAGFPDRVARRREPGGERVIMASGRGAKLAPESVVRTAPLLIALEVDDTRGRAAGGDSLIRVASAVEESWLAETGLVEETHEVRFNEARGAVEAVLQRRYGSLVLAERRDDRADPAQLSKVLAEHARASLDRLISEEAEKVLLRLEFLRRERPDLDLPELDPAALLEDLAFGKKSIAELKNADWISAINNTLGYRTMQQIDSLAPDRIEVPSGSKIRLRYEHEGPPVLAVRLQEIFGLEHTPKVAGGRVPVKMELLAPNQRPVQVTQDLDSFWARTYPEVRKDLRARYPKHSWPEDGRTAPPQRRPSRRRK